MYCVVKDILVKLKKGGPFQIWSYQITKLSSPHETLIKLQLPNYQVTLYIYNFFCKGNFGRNLERGDPYKCGNTKIPDYQTTKVSSPHKTFGTLSFEKKT